MRSVEFITPTRLSLIDITTMGDSSKRNDETKIGQFDSGLKYAIALLLRHNVSFEVTVVGGKVDRGGWEEPFIELFKVKTFTEICNNTKKEKELIGFSCETFYHGGKFENIKTTEKPTPKEEYFIKTGFAKNLGYNWELWMAFRELYSNMLDEGGYMIEGDSDREVDYGTVITLTFEEDNPFAEIIKNKHLYINTEDYLFKVDSGLEAIKNEEGYTRIYKNNILVYEDKKKPSLYAYNINFGQIDERRILSDVYSVCSSIVSRIMYSHNKEFLRTLMFTEDVLEDDLLYKHSNYVSANDSLKEVVEEFYFENNETVYSYPFITEAVKKREDCKIKGKKIESIGDHLWGYASTVEILSAPKEQSSPKTVKEIILSLYDIEINYEVKVCELKGDKCIADKFEKCIYVSEDFDAEKDFHRFIVQHIDLEMKGNIIENLAKMVIEKIRK
jgi:hypothetical protein